MGAFLAVAIAAAMATGVIDVTYGTPAFANDATEEFRREREQQRREREEARRQRDEQRAARDEQRRQRDAERAERAAERAQREEERRQRQAEREQQASEREQQRQVNEQTREQQRAERQADREAQRAAREQERASRQAEREERGGVRQDDQRDDRRVRDNDGGRGGRSNSNNGNAGNWNGGGGNSGTSNTSDRSTNTVGTNSGAMPTAALSSRSGGGNNNSNNTKSENSDKAGKTDKADKTNKENKADKNNPDNGNDADDESDSASDSQIEVIEQEPPRTLVEMINRMTGNASSNGSSGNDGNATSGANNASTAATSGSAAASTAKSGSASKNAKDTPSTTAAAKDASKSAAKAGSSKTSTGATASSRVRQGQPDFELLQLGAFRPHEIIGTGIRNGEASLIRSLGFSVGAPVLAPGNEAGVRKLIVPAGMNEQTAMQLLRDKVPSAEFGPNHIYRIVPAAEVSASSKPAAHAPQPETDGATGCRGEGCFAHKLIRWNGSLGQCAKRVRIGIIDTSFDTTHPAFKSLNFKPEFFNTGGMPAKDDWHGTAVLSVLAARGVMGAPGLVPEAEYLLANTFGADSEGNAAADALAVVAALAWLDKNGAGIVNMSFSGPANDRIEQAISAMARKGVIFVAAAGNRGPHGPASYPAAYPDVIAVTAVGSERQLYRHANSGDYVDVAAPGIEIATALPRGGYGLRTGTSFAAPFVTGLLAALPGVRKGAHSKEDLLARVSFEDLGEPGRDAVYGEGLPIAPKTCSEVGGVASLPWSNAAKRMSVGAPPPPKYVPASTGWAATVR